MKDVFKFTMEKYSLMKLFDVYPLNDVTIIKASGSYVWDEKGIEYLDMYGGHAVISIGHTHPHWGSFLVKLITSYFFVIAALKRMKMP